jgi:putative nucleotidyltransferase with HDIG domain
MADGLQVQRPRADSGGETVMTETDAHPNVEHLLREAQHGRLQSLASRERLAESLCTGVLAVAMLALVAVAPVGHVPWVTAVVLVVAYAITRRVTFSLGAGYVTAGQPILVPMLILLPAPLVPLLVLAGHVLDAVPQVARRRVALDHLLLVGGDTWYALGPAIVLAAFAPGRPALSHWPVYVAALGAQFVGDTAATVVREWLANGVPPRLQLRLLGLAYAVDAALAPIGLLTALAAAHHPAAVVLVLPLIALLAALGKEREKRIQHALALSDAYRGSALLVGDMLLADDEYTGGEHTGGVVSLSLAVGEELGLDGREMRELEFGALLHDVGKLRTPKEIINKPGKLDDGEWEIIKRHPVDGQQMLDRIGGVLAEVGLVVRAHHERWDGAGYPDGLAGEAIPLTARIVCACDAFSAMTTTRSYRKALPVEVAVAELCRCAGTQFDPRVVEALVAVIERENAPCAETPLPLAA